MSSLERAWWRRNSRGTVPMLMLLNWEIELGETNAGRSSLVVSAFLLSNNKRVDLTLRDRIGTGYRVPRSAVCESETMMRRRERCLWEEWATFMHHCEVVPALQCFHLVGRHHAVMLAV